VCLNNEIVFIWRVIMSGIKFNKITLENNTAYFSVRDINGDGANKGKFFINGHATIGGFQTQSNNHQYNHKRTARVMAKRLAARLGVPYRQDLEYMGDGYPKDQTVVAIDGSAGAVV
jgi:hypothetical protein